MNMLDSLVTVRQRFARCVALARDAHGSAGYLLTPTGGDVLRRLAKALRTETLIRASSLTAPYGSGKPAFALIAAQALARKQWVMASLVPSLFAQFDWQQGCLDCGARKAMPLPRGDDCSAKE